MFARALQIASPKEKSNCVGSGLVICLPQGSRRRANACSGFGLDPARPLAGLLAFQAPGRRAERSGERRFPLSAQPAPLSVPCLYDNHAG